MNVPEVYFQFTSQVTFSKIEEETIMFQWLFDEEVRMLCIISFHLILSEFIVERVIVLRLFILHNV